MSIRTWGLRPTFRSRKCRMTKLEEFEIILSPQPEGGFIVAVPELPDVADEGDSPEQAIDMSHEAIKGYLETVAGLEYPIPPRN